MNPKEYIDILGFKPKDNTTGVYCKAYNSCKGYTINIDLVHEQIDYGTAIKSDSKTTQNFSQTENFVVLECVDRLLKKGYQPHHIVLEKTWPSGHGTSGRLDILVNHDNGTPYMLIECKTYGREFEKELAKINKDGGQLFTYFQLSGHKADVLMLYASECNAGKIRYRNEIVKIENNYRSGEVKDIFEKWNKLTRNNGIFDNWVKPYNFQNKAITKSQLKEISSEDSSFIFNRFLEILRHNVVSDKGNAFNKIFTLFLCKVYDETSHRDDEELDFQWKEGIDNHVDFQLRLTDLYRRGMEKFLKRKVSDFDREKFDQQFVGISEEARNYLLLEVNKIRLEKNNEFAIKEVYDHASFEENARVVKEVVELLQGYRIRYNRRQQYLSDFFELLLTTGLKQEVGQYFTPVPIAQFIIKSIPLDDIVHAKLTNDDGHILPYLIDYASGSGHFITEYMHEVQTLINQCDASNYIDETRHKIEHWQRDHFDWATQYVYGIEKDYRLVKVGKVGCYLHGDGLANVILSDGLARFSHNEYTGLLHKSSDDGSRDNPQFDIVLSNPPYSVSAFRQTTRDYYNEEDFELYNSLTDNSSEIECLFVERTKQLLKEGGVAGVILPSSLLTNSGIETKAREIILKYFDIVGLVELGSNTFMATGTNTVVLFLRRRDNYLANNIRNAVDKYILNLQEVTIGCVEKPISNYVHEVWGVSLDDYNTLLRKKPNDTILASNLFKAYRQEVTTKKEDEFWNTVIGIEAEKIACHILTSRQKVVVVKSGEKKDEKQFLGYEFSNRRGNEGIHAVGHSKRIEECTMLFDPDSYTNPDKASTYIYKAFKGEFPTPTGKLKDHVSTVQLSQIINFSRGRFAKEILTTAGNKPPLDSKYPMMCLGGTDGVCEIRIGGTPSRKNPEYFTGSHPWVSIAEMRGQVITDTKEKITDEGIRTSNVKLIPRGTTLLSFKLSIGRTAVAGVDLYTNEAIAALIPKDKTVVSDDYLFALFNGHFIDLENTGNKAFGKSLNSTHLNNEVKIPVPPMDIQRQIVAECRQIDEEYNRSRMAIETCRRKTAEVFERIEVSHKTSELQNLLLPVAGPTTKIPQTQILSHGKTPVVTQLNGATISGYTDNDAPITDLPLIVFGDHSCTFKYLDFPFVRGADGTQLLKVDEHVILTKYLYHYLRTLQIPNTGKYERHYKYLKQQLIPIPSIEEQRKMVDEIDRYDSTIADARQAMASCADRKHALLLKFLH